MKYTGSHSINISRQVFGYFRSTMPHSQVVQAVFKPGLQKNLSSSVALRHTLASLPLSSLWLAQARSQQQHYYTLAPPSWQNGPLQPSPVGASCSNLCWETKPEKKVLFAFSAWVQTQPLYALHAGLRLALTQHAPNLITKVWLELLKTFLKLNSIFPFHLLFTKVFRECLYSALFFSCRIL